jgi:predicted esterase
MNSLLTFILFATIIAFSGCRSTAPLPEDNLGDTARSPVKLKTATSSIDFVIHKPNIPSADAFLLFHGTVASDEKAIPAARLTLAKSRKLIGREDALYVSVAYPQEDLLIGDNLKHAETALLWLKTSASKELGIEIKRIFLLGHSQGGYLVTRLNALHRTDGVIANAPGPLNFTLRCELEEKKKIPASEHCRKMKVRFGSTKDNPSPYEERSLLSHLRNFKSRILFTQGTSDTKIQMTSWPVLKEAISKCSTCRDVVFRELEGGHDALFENPQATEIVRNFIK